MDDELLDSAGDILTALCHGGPAEDITDYSAASETIDQYLTVVAGRPPTLTRVTAVLRLARYLASDRAASLNWTDDAARTRLRHTCDRLVGQPDWLLAVDRALDSPDLPRFRLAIWPARQLGIPTRSRVRARVHAHPEDGYLWQTLADDAGGPTLDLGLDAGQPHHILDLIVSRLDAHPGRGWPLIRIALGNPTIRNRTMAIRALAAWPPDTVPNDVRAALQQASLVEPDPATRNDMRQLLATWRLPARQRPM